MKQIDTTICQVGGFRIHEITNEADIWIIIDGKLKQTIAGYQRVLLQKCDKTVLEIVTFGSNIFNGY